MALQWNLNDGESRVPTEPLSVDGGDSSVLPDGSPTDTPAADPSPQVREHITFLFRRSGVPLR